MTSSSSLIRLVLIMYFRSSEGCRPGCEGGLTPDPVAGRRVEVWGSRSFSMGSMSSLGTGGTGGRGSTRSNKCTLRMYLKCSWSTKTHVLILPPSIIHTLLTNHTKHPNPKRQNSYKKWPYVPICNYLEIKELDPRTIKMRLNFFSEFNFKIIKPCNRLYCSTQYPA